MDMDTSSASMYSTCNSAIDSNEVSTTDAETDSAMITQIDQLMHLLKSTNRELNRIKEEFQAYKESTERRLMEQDTKINMNFTFAQKFMSEMRAPSKEARGQSNGQDVVDIPSDSSTTTNKHPPVTSTVKKRKKNAPQISSSTMDIEDVSTRSPRMRDTAGGRDLSKHSERIPVQAPTPMLMADDDGEDDPSAGRTSIPVAVDDFEDEEKPLVTIHPAESKSSTTSKSPKKPITLAEAHKAAVFSIRQRLLEGKARLANRRSSTPIRTTTDLMTSITPKIDAEQKPTLDLLAKVHNQASLDAAARQIDHHFRQPNQLPREDQSVSRVVNSTFSTPERFQAIKLNNRIEATLDDVSGCRVAPPSTV